MVGLFASGKSSIIDGVLQRSRENALTMLPIYTTRLPRNSVEANGGSTEYRFVSDAEYEGQKAKSKKWNERIASGAKYGIDVEEIEANTATGVVYLTTMLPHADTLKEQRETFACPVFQVLVDVPLDVCNQRLLDRGHEVANRLMLQGSLDVDACRKIVNARFVPVGVSVDTDVQRFCRDFAEFLKLGSV